MTGLINRREFERRLEEALEATAGGARHVLCYPDLDRFKAVNDECGYMVGDTMLREVATLIRTRCATRMYPIVSGSEGGLRSVRI